MGNPEVVGSQRLSEQRIHSPWLQDVDRFDRPMTMPSALPCAIGMGWVGQLRLPGCVSGGR